MAISACCICVSLYVYSYCTSKYIMTKINAQLRECMIEAHAVWDQINCLATKSLYYTIGQNGEADWMAVMMDVQ